MPALLFSHVLIAMAGVLFFILVVCLLTLKADIGRSKRKVGFTQLFSKTREINILSAARFFLFGARDVWFVVGLPIFLTEVMGWSFWETGAFLAAWVIGYGGVQASAPRILRRRAHR